VAKYLDLQATSLFARIPLIKRVGTEGEYVIENCDIAKELLYTFFPALPPCEQEEVQANYN
jgi:hypothetical protein